LVRNTEKFNKVYEAYEKLATFYPHYDYTRTTSEALGRFLDTPILSAYPPLPADTIGSRTASFLFVGDVANQEELDLPFFAWGGSSEYFYVILKEAGYTEPEMAFTNAYRLDKTERNFIGLVHELKQNGGGLLGPQIIALGNNAANVLGKQAVDHLTVPHPQYWKRFHSKQSSLYIQALRDIRTTLYRSRQLAATRISGDSSS